MTLLLRESFALVAARLAAGAIATVLLLDVVPGIAVGVVVVDRCFDRVPGACLGHGWPPFERAGYRPPGAEGHVMISTGARSS